MTSIVNRSGIVVRTTAELLGARFDRYEQGVLGICCSPDGGVCSARSGGLKAARMVGRESADRHADDTIAEGPFAGLRGARHIGQIAKPSSAG